MRVSEQCQGLLALTALKQCSGLVEGLAVGVLPVQPSRLTARHRPAGRLWLRDAGLCRAAGSALWGSSSSSRGSSLQLGAQGAVGGPVRWQALLQYRVEWQPAHADSGALLPQQEHTFTEGATGMGTILFFFEKLPLLKAI